MEINQIVLITFLSIYSGLILIEYAISVKLDKKVYDLKDSLANTFIVFINQLLRPLAILFGYFIFSTITPFQLWHLESSLLIVLLCFFGVEFMYYWYHRLSHEVKLFWTLHHSHHSSQSFNYSVAGRINWLDKFVGIGIYIPLILLGFSPELITILLVINLFYQLLLHTQLIQKLGFLEGWINTPSAHRVHHGYNPEYLDKNYGGILLIYDKLFGTYQKEEDTVQYGVTTGFIGYNPFKIVFKPLMDYFKKILTPTSSPKLKIR